MDEGDRCGLLYVRNDETNCSIIVNNRFVISNKLSSKLRFSRPQSYSIATDGQFFPKQLFQLCKELIVYNLDLLDSLKGFPEQIAEHLFLDASHLGCFNWTKSKRGMKILFVDQAWKHMQILLDSTLTKLDVSHCDLGDDHEIFKHFQHFPCLVILNIANNSLTIDAIRLLTMSIRFSQKGPKKLMTLNISGNCFMDKEALTFLSKSFNDLQHLDISGTLIKESDCSMFTQKGFCIVKDFMNTDLGRFETIGWAKNLINQWEDVKSHTPSAILKFYGNTKKTGHKNVSSVTSSSLVLVKMFLSCIPIVEQESNIARRSVKEETCFDKELLLNYL